MSTTGDTVVLVTGGTRGIGLACAALFAQRGAKVALCGRSAASAEAAAESLRQDHPDATIEGYQADIAKADDVDRLVKDITRAFGPVSVLVNNAGITHDGLIMRMKNSDWATVIETNLTGAFHTCRAVSRDMLKQHSGRIINISSIVGLRGQGGQANYAAAKAGLIGFSKSLAKELASRNITVNVVAPGFITTEMTQKITGDLRKKLLENTPLGREGSPTEVAEAVHFLASDKAAYITGQVLCVDGGAGM